MNLRNPNYPKWRKVNGVGKRAIVTDGCERAWLRFRKGQFFIYINGNVNDEAIFTKPSKASAKLCEQGRDAVSQRLSETAGRIANVIAEAIGAS